MNCLVIRGSGGLEHLSRPPIRSPISLLLPRLATFGRLLEAYSSSIIILLAKIQDSFLAYPLKSANLLVSPTTHPPSLLFSNLRCPSSTLYHVPKTLSAYRQTPPRARIRTSLPKPSRPTSPSSSQTKTLSQPRLSLTNHADQQQMEGEACTGDSHPDVGITLDLGLR